MQNDFVKTVNFRVFSSFDGIQIRFPSQVDVFCFEFHLNLLSGAVEASQKGINAMVTLKRLYPESCHFFGTCRHTLQILPMLYNFVRVE